VRRELTNVTRDLHIHIKQMYNYIREIELRKEEELKQREKTLSKRKN
jgi:hypothetical protein